MKLSKMYFALLWLKLSGRLPLTACRILGAAIGSCFWCFPSRTRQVTEANIAHCFPALSAKEQRQLAKKSMQHSCINLLEIAAVWHQPFAWLEKKITRIEGQPLLDNALADNNGAIFLIPHLGNWEVVGLFLAQQAATTSLYEPTKAAELNDYVRRARQKTGAELVPTNNRGVSQLLKHLRKGGITCILPDQVPNKKSGFVEATFFNRTANTMTLASNLVNKTHCHVVCAYAKREGSGFTLVFSPISEAIKSDDGVASACALNAAIETAVQAIPEQYQWEYKRFKYQANGY